MPFTLHVTFAGLCLFQRKPRNRLVVLMPKTPTHQHEAVLGFHVRYAGQTGQPGCRFEEFDLRGRMLDLSDLSTSDIFEPNFPEALDDAGVADISDIVDTPAKKAKAVARVEIAHGRVCPATECAAPSGAFWELCGEGGGVTVCKEPQFMAISLQWIISGVTGQVEEGMEKLELKIRDLKTGNVVTALTLRPDSENRIRIYVFHARANELPSSPGAPRKRLKKGDRAHHFRELKDLFDRPRLEPEPRFHAYKRADEQFVERLFLGRLFTCMVASAEGE